MASSLEFIEYVCEQLERAGSITYKKMFGEYGVYCNGKIIGLVCDNQFFIKKTVAGAAFLENPTEEAPYKGSKPYFFIENLDDKEFLGELVRKSWDEMPMQKVKPKKQ